MKPESPHEALPFAAAAFFAGVEPEFAQSDWQPTTAYPLGRIPTGNRGGHRSSFSGRRVQRWSGGRRLSFAGKCRRFLQPWSSTRLCRRLTRTGVGGLQWARLRGADKRCGVSGRDPAWRRAGPWTAEPAVEPSITYWSGLKAYNGTCMCWAVMMERFGK